jgi:hypothetical protein
LLESSLAVGPSPLRVVEVKPNEEVKPVILLIQNEVGVKIKMIIREWGLTRKLDR